MVLEGPAANGIGKGIAERLSCGFGKIEHKIFPDGESYIRMPAIEGENFAVVQSTYAPSEKHLIELLFMIDALKDMGKEKLTAVVPYLAYSRHDRRFSEGEAVSINTILRLLSESGIERLITVEPHREEPFSSFSGKYTIIDPVLITSSYIIASFPLRSDFMEEIALTLLLSGSLSFSIKS